MATTAQAFAQLQGQEEKAAATAFDSPYSQVIAGLLDQVQREPSYTGAYDAELKGLLDEIASAGSYQSPYTDAIVQLFGKAQSYGGYEGSYKEAIADKLAQLSDYGSYQSRYESDINDLTQELKNASFQYDAESDPQYQALTRRYLREADRTASDVLAKASAATGGRASSYAVTAASQAADAFKSQLTAQQQALYEAAYQRYRNEYAQRLGLLTQLENQRAQEFTRWRAGLQDLRDDLAMLNDQDSIEYARWQNEYDALKDKLSLLWARDAEERAAWQADNAFTQEKYAALKAADDSDYARRRNDYADILERLGVFSEQYDSDYANWRAERTDAYNRLTQLITLTGYKPSEEELAFAGMTQQEADNWLWYFRQGYSSGSGGGSSGSGKTATVGESNIVDISQLRAGITSVFNTQGKDSANYSITQLKNSGAITASQATSLYNEVSTLYKRAEAEKKTAAHTASGGGGTNTDRL